MASKNWNVPTGDDPTPTEHSEGMQQAHTGPGIAGGVGNEVQSLVAQDQQAVHG